MNKKKENKKIQYPENSIDYIWNVEANCLLKWVYGRVQILAVACDQ